MLITRASDVSGVVRTKDLNVTPEQIEAYNSGGLLQDCFPNLSGSDREFIKTGITDEEWNSMFGEEFIEEMHNDI